jgi:hypothetical protein
MEFVVFGLVVWVAVLSFRISGLSTRVAGAINEARSAKEALVFEQTSHAQMVDAHDDEIRRLREQLAEFSVALGRDGLAHHK